jgi:hypothetical protein
MPDGDEIGDVEEASVDDDSPPPRNRQSIVAKEGYQGEQGVIFMR